MAAKRTEYQIVGRYMDGPEVVAYHLQCLEQDKSGRYTKDQVYYLVGREQVTNCTGQIYQDKVLLKGKGINLSDLPIIGEDGSLKNTDAIGKVRKGTSAVDAVNQFMIVKVIKQGRYAVEYIIQNAGGGTKRVSRPQLIEAARAGKIGNARVQTYNGEDVLRGVGINLDELPYEQVDG